MAYSEAEGATEKLVINISTELKAKLREFADESHRSLSGQIRWMLDWSLYALEVCPEVKSTD